MQICIHPKVSRIKNAIFVSQTSGKQIACHCIQTKWQQTMNCTSHVKLQAMLITNPFLEISWCQHANLKIENCICPKSRGFQMHFPLDKLTITEWHDIDCSQKVTNFAWTFTTTNQFLRQLWAFLQTMLEKYKLLKHLQWGLCVSVEWQKMSEENQGAKCNKEIENNITLHAWS